MKKMLLMWPLMLSLGYLIAADEMPLPDPEVTVGAEELDQPAEPPLEEPTITDITETPCTENCEEKTDAVE